MTKRILQFGLAAVLASGLACLAQAPAGAPDGATGQCKDGTYTTVVNKGKACRGHQGVKTWYQTVGGVADPDIKSGSGTQSANTKRTAKSDATVNPHTDAEGVSGSRAQAINKKSGNTAVATQNDSGKVLPGPAEAGPAANGSASGSTKGGSGHSASAKTAAPGGGPGLVWVNNDSKVYHCYGSQFYGKTKDGKYVSEQEAKQMGAKPDHGKGCSK